MEADSAWELVDEFVARVQAVSNPTIDNWFAELRDSLAKIGVTNITPDQARVTLALIGYSQSMPEDVQLLLNGYLGTIAGRGSEEDEEWSQLVDEIEGGE